MDTIKKVMLFEGKAVVSIVDAKEIATHALALHKPSQGAGEVLGRVLAITSFMAAGLKGYSLKLSITINGDGALGKIITCGTAGGKVRGYIENKNAKIPIKENRADLNGAIGKGEITVIKDFGMKEPYVGRAQIVNGSIDSDFAYYFTTSEQLPSAAASGCKIVNGEVVACGAIIVQPMPNCDESIIVMLEDIVSNFKDFGEMMAVRSLDEIIDFYFGHFDNKLLDQIEPSYECNCSSERMDKIVISLGHAEASTIVRESGYVEIHCDFCNKYYRYGKAEVNNLFKK